MSGALIALIAVVARNGAIGRDNGLLWHLPEDLRHFRETTRGKAVIMGRRTWESLPEAFRPLPGRRNVVLTRDRAFVAGGEIVVHTLADALAAAAPEKVGSDEETAASAAADEVFVIGGAELYRQALPLAQRLYLTEVAADADGDAFFPALDPSEWREVRRRQGSSSEPPFAFVDYERVVR